MPEIAPFEGLLFDPANAGDLAAVTAPPYDVILPHDLARYLRASPHNIARIDLGEGGETADPREKYTRAGSLLRAWRDEGVLVGTGGPAVYPYEMRFVYRAEERRVRGVIAAVTLEALGKGVIPHERTMAGPVADRLEHMRGTRANLSPIYAVCSGPSEPQTELLERTGSRPADREVADEEGVLHRLWIERDGGALLDWYMTESLLIADGHHRYRTALAFRDEMHAAEGPGPWDAVMMLVVDAASEDPPVLPIHRVVSLEAPPRIPGSRVRDLAEVLAWCSEDDLRFGAVHRDGPDLVHLVGRLGGDPPTVSALHEELLDPMEGVREVRFVPDAALAEELVREGRRDLALFLPPARVTNLRGVVEAGGSLPQKSTYFWPKPRTGLVMRPLF